MGNLKSKNLIKLLLFLKLSFLPAILLADMYPIFPVRVEITKEITQFRIKIEANSTIFRKEILRNENLPPENWPDELKESAKKYIDSRFLLNMGDQRLEGQLIHCFFVHNPWEHIDKSKVIFYLNYPFNSLKGNFLGTVSFFEEEWKHHKGAQPGFQSEFKTFLIVKGVDNIEFNLDLQNKDFSIPFQKIRTSKIQSYLTNWHAGFTRFIKIPALLLIAASFVLAWPGKSIALKSAIGSFLILIIFSLFNVSIHWSRLELVPWILLVILNLFFWKWPNYYLYGSLGVSPIGGLLCSFYTTSYQDIIHSELFSPSFFIFGFLSSAMFVLGFTYGVIYLFRVKLKNIRESYFEESFRYYQSFIQLLSVFIGLIITIREFIV